jgi:transposase InsO family protein
VAYYKSLGVTVTRVMTDNGSCYKAFDFRDACQEIGLKHKRTKPYTPKTNGKAERFIQSRPRSGSGLMRKPTPHQTAAPRNSPTGFIDTTGIGRMGG